MPLGLIFQNENVTDEMIEIMEHIHQEYVPTAIVSSETGDHQEVVQTIFFGGDQLTEERARTAKDARADGDTDFEKLEGLQAKHEDWHAIRLVYQVHIFNKQEKKTS